MGEGGLARETEGSGAAARSPCRWRQASKQRTRGSPDPSPPTHPALPRWPACDEPLRGVRRGITRGGALQPPPSPTMKFVEAKDEEELVEEEKKCHGRNSFTHIRVIVRGLICLIRS
uniref:Uncharacterized protein n=1 Tax=Triticum urartu TaxID=4572 RepID=A0A8R7QFP3_TRIUA